MFYDLVIGSSGGFIMMAIPELPRGLAFKDLSSMAATGLRVGDYTLTGDRQGPNMKGNWYAPVMNDWLSWSHVNPTTHSVSNPWGASKARIITQAYRMMYTGETLSCAGTITVSENELGIEDGLSLNDKLTSQIRLDGTPSPTTWPPNSIHKKELIVASPTNALNATSVVQPMSQGAYFVLARNTTATPWTNAQQPFFLSEHDTTDTHVTFFTIVSGVSYPVSALYDSSFTPKMAVVAGMTPGTTIRVEMMACVEFEPSMSSSFREFAKAPPTSRLNTIATTESAVSKLPVAGPLNWTDTIIAAALGAIKVGKAIAAAL